MSSPPDKAPIAAANRPPVFTRNDNGILVPIPPESPVDAESGGQGAIRVAAATHPLLSRYHEYVIPEGLTLDEMLCRVQPDPVLRAHAHIFIGDTLIPRERWHLVTPTAGSMVSIKIVPHGGGKSPLRIILTIAVIAVAFYFAAPLGTALGIGEAGIAIGTATLSAAQVGSAVILTGGFILVNAIAPIKPPLASPNERESPSYFLETARNALRPYSPVPAILGRHRVVPPLGATVYTEVVGNTNHLRMVVVWGYGPLLIENLRIGQTPLEDFDDIQVETLEGRADDDDLTLYPGDVAQENFDIELEQSTGWVSRTTAPDADEISIDIGFPRGIVRYDKKGRRRSSTVTFQVQVRKTGTSDWLVPETVSRVNQGVRGSGPYLRGAYGTWATSAFAGYTGSTATADQGRITVSGSRTEPIRHGYRWKTGERAQWDVRVRRTTPPPEDDREYNAMRWVTLRSFTDRAPIDFDKPLAMTALVIRATDQLNRVVDQLNAIVTSEVLDWDAGNEEWTARASSNPASLVRHVLQGPMNERPVADADIDLEALQGFHEFCDAHDFRFDAIIDYRKSDFDILRDICGAGRASPSWQDGKWSVLWDSGEQLPVQHFGPRNSSGFSMQRSFDEPPHGLRLRFSNRDMDWRRDELIVYNDGYSEANAEVFVDLEPTGITDPSHLYVYGRFHLAQLLLRRERWTLTAGLDSLLARRGSRVLITHDVLLVGQRQARIAAIDQGPPIVLTLDEEIVMERGNDYGIVVRTVNDQNLTSRVLTQPGQTHDAQLVDPPDTFTRNVRVGDLLSFGEFGLETIDGLVVDVQPQEELAGSLTMLPWQPGVYSADTEPIPPFDSRITLPPSTPDLLIVNVRSDDSSLLPVGETLQPFIHVEVAPIDFTQSSIEVQIRTSRTQEPYYPAVVISRGDDFVIIGNVDIGNDYDLRMRWVISGDFLPGAWAEHAGHTVIGPAIPSSLTGLQAVSLGNAALLRWDPISDLDVRIGGVVRFRHSIQDIGDATWANSVPIGQAVQGHETSVVLPLKAGTYTARVFNDAGLAGPDTQVSTRQINVLSFSLVERLNEAPAFAGVKVDTSVSGGMLRLDAGETEGSYTFHNALTLEEVQTVRLTTEVRFVASSDTDTIDNRTADLDDWDSWDGGTASVASVEVQVRSTDDDPAGTPTWSAWERIDAGEYEGRGFQFRAILRTGDIEHYPLVSALAVSAELPSVTEGADGEEGVGIEYVFTSSEDGDMITGAANLPLSTWNYDIPALRTEAGVARGEQAYFDGTPFDLSETRPFMHRFSREVPGQPAIDEDIGARAWRQEPAVRIFGQQGEDGEEGVGVEYIFTSSEDGAAITGAGNLPLATWNYDAAGLAAGITRGDFTYYDGQPADLSATRPFQVRFHRSVPGAPEADQDIGPVDWVQEAAVRAVGEQGEQGPQGEPGFTNRLGFRNFTPARGNVDADREWHWRNVPATGWPIALDFLGYVTGVSSLHPVNHLDIGDAVLMWRSSLRWAWYELTTMDTVHDDNELSMQGTLIRAMGNLGPLAAGDDIELRYTPAGQQGEDGEEGVGVEYVFTSSADGRTITGAANLPLATWNYDAPALRTAAGITRGTQRYFDGTPADIGEARPFMHRFSRPVSGAPARDEDIGSVPWVQETATRQVGQEGDDGEEGVGVEYVFTSSATGATITGSANLPLGSWSYDLPALGTSAGVARGTQTYYDGTPPDLSSARPYQHRFSRPVPGAPAADEDIGTVAWRQEAAVRLVGQDGEDGEEGVGVEYIFTSSADGQAITGNRNLPLASWNYDIPGLRTTGGVTRGTQSYFDGTPPDLSDTRPFQVRFSRSVPGQPAADEDIGSSAWTQETAVRVIGQSGEGGEEGVGVEYIFTSSIDGATITGNANLPLATWNYDAPGLVAGITRGTQTYFDGTPTDLDEGRPFRHRFARSVPGQPAVDEDIGSISWTQEAAVRVVGQPGPGGYSNRLGFRNFVATVAEVDEGREWNVPASGIPATGWPATMQFTGYVTGTFATHPINRLDVGSVVLMWRAEERWAWYELTAMDTAHTDNIIQITGTRISASGSLAPVAAGDAIEVRYTPAGVVGAPGGEGLPGFSNRLLFTEYVAATTDLDTDREWHITPAAPATGWPNNATFTGYVTGTGALHPVNRLDSESEVILWRATNTWAVYDVGAISGASDDNELAISGMTLINSSGNLGALSAGSQRIELRYTPPDAAEMLQTEIVAIAPGAPTQPPINLTVLSDRAFALVSWEDVRFGPPATGYDIRYRWGLTSSNRDDILWLSWDEDTLPVTETSYRFRTTGFRAWQVQVRATNSSGDGPWASWQGELDIESSDTFPFTLSHSPEPPRNPRVVAGDGAFLITWDRARLDTRPPAGDEEQQYVAPLAIPDEYLVSWKRRAETAWQGRYTRDLYAFVILAEDSVLTTWDIRVASVRDGRRLQSDAQDLSVTISTQTAVPGKPVGLSVTPITAQSNGFTTNPSIAAINKDLLTTPRWLDGYLTNPTGIVLGWQPPTSGGAVSSFQSQFKKTSASTWTDAWSLTGGFTTAAAHLSHPITEMEARVSYDFRVRARNSIGTGAWSDVLTSTFTPDNDIIGQFLVRPTQERLYRSPPRETEYSYEYWATLHGGGIQVVSNIGMPNLSAITFLQADNEDLSSSSSPSPIVSVSIVLLAGGIPFTDTTTDAGSFGTMEIILEGRTYTFNRAGVTFGSSLAGGHLIWTVPRGTEGYELAALRLNVGYCLVQFRRPAPTP